MYPGKFCFFVGFKVIFEAIKRSSKFLTLFELINKVWLCPNFVKKIKKMLLGFMAIN